MRSRERSFNTQGAHKAEGCQLGALLRDRRRACIAGRPGFSRHQPRHGYTGRALREDIDKEEGLALKWPSTRRQWVNAECLRRFGLTSDSQAIAFRATHAQVLYSLSAARLHCKNHPFLRMAAAMRVLGS